MSRHILEPLNSHYEVSVGWDRPLANFFLQSSFNLTQQVHYLLRLVLVASVKFAGHSTSSAQSSIRRTLVAEQLHSGCQSPSLQPADSPM